MIITELPTEVVIKCFSYLDLMDLVRSKRVCKIFYHVAWKGMYGKALRILLRYLPILAHKGGILHTLVRFSIHEARIMKYRRVSAIVKYPIHASSRNNISNYCNRCCFTIVKGAHISKLWIESHGRELLGTRHYYFTTDRMRYHVMRHPVIAGRFGLPTFSVTNHFRVCANSRAIIIKYIHIGTFFERDYEKDELDRNYMYTGANFVNW